MHYERLTRHILAEMPNRADIVFDLDESHSAASVHINDPVDGGL
jgi:D-glycerate 3-kinase